jgi:hypothetical protein
MLTPECQIYEAWIKNIWWFSGRFQTGLDTQLNGFAKCKRSRDITFLENLTSVCHIMGLPTLTAFWLCVCFSADYEILHDRRCFVFAH